MRHGEVEPNAIGRFVGIKDVALSDLGRHQGAAIASYLEDAELDVLLSSPRQRSRDTIAPLAEAKEMQVEVRDGLQEMHFGDWEGLSWEEIHARDPAFADAWQENVATTPCPGGQSANDFANGVHFALQEILEEFEGRTIAIAAHAGTNRAILASALNRQYVESFHFAQDYGCLNALGYGTHAYPQVALLNLVPGPRSEHPSW